MKKLKLLKIFDLIVILTIAIPALILGGIIGIWRESFRQGYLDGKRRVS